MTLRIESGHPMLADVQPVPGDKVRFVTDDGRTMFEVGVGADGRSIEVRSVETTKHGGKIYDTVLLVRPCSSNGITVSTALYDKS